MFAPRLSSTARLVSAAAAGLMVLSTASYANDYQQLFPGQVQGAPHANARVYHGSGYVSSYPSSAPQDFVSSHLCINGYRWITRERGRWESPAENAIPVRC